MFMLAAAGSLDRGRRSGPRHGIPKHGERGRIVKDFIDHGRLPENAMSGAAN